MPLRPLLLEHDIHNRIAELGRQIDSDYPEGDLLLLCILKGASIFHADLARSIRRNVFLDYMGISSYGREKDSSGQVQITKDLNIPVEGTHVLIVEDIVDTGITLDYLSRLIEQRKPLSLAICTLLDKPSRRLRAVDVKYVGFIIPDEFVVGFGLDYAERYRNLPNVCVLEEGAV